MSWVLTVLGIVALIVLHELGHFLAAKATGMRVERFSLFFPPRLFGIRRGETEYMVGAIPAGGYVKITGMTPEEIEDADPAVAARERAVPARILGGRPDADARAQHAVLRREARPRACALPRRARERAGLRGSRERRS